VHEALGIGRKAIEMSIVDREFHTHRSDCPESGVIMYTEGFLDYIGQLFEQWHIQMATSRYHWLRGEARVPITAKNPLDSHQLFSTFRTFLEEENDSLTVKRLILWSDAFDWNALNQSILTYTWKIEQIKQEYSAAVKDTYYLVRHHKDKNVRHKAYQKKCRIASKLVPQYRDIVEKITDVLQVLGFPDELEFASHRAGLPVSDVLRELERSTRKRYCELLSYYQEKYMEIEVWEINFLKNVLSAEVSLESIEYGFSSILDRIGYPLQSLRSDYLHNSRLNSAVCIGIEVPHNVKVLIPPRDGFLFHQALVHEMAHALHLSSIKCPEIEFRYLGTPTCPEALAFLFQRFFSQIQDSDDLFQLGEFFHVITARQLCAAAEFELSAFKDSSALQQLYQDIYSRLLYLPAPEENDFLIETPFVSQPLTLPSYAGGFWLCEKLSNLFSLESSPEWNDSLADLMSKGHILTPLEMVQQPQY
jgi:hypothetical protein